LAAIEPARDLFFQESRFNGKKVSSSNILIHMPYREVLTSGRDGCWRRGLLGIGALEGWYLLSWDEGPKAWVPLG